MRFFVKEDIMSRDGTELYIKRLRVISSRFFSVYIHQFHRSDDPIPHDHPWDFITLPLTHGYTEHFYDSYKGTKRKINRLPLIPAYRKAEDVHWVELHPKTKPWTICILFKKRKPWGFMERFYGGFRWIEEKVYLRNQRNKKIS